MALQLFANNATGYLSSSITSSATSIVLQSGQGSKFPSPTGSDYFLITLFDGSSTLEICKCTSRSSDTLTVVRAQEGTTAAAFSSGSLCELRATKGTFEGLTQNASAAITGGSISGITDLAIADGGTGASTASDARTNLGLGSIATQAASSVSITGGSVSGITDLAVADGGTGSSTAAGARTNLSAVGYTTTTGSATLPAGNTGERGSGAAGYIRFNTETNSFEGYNNTTWGSIGGGGATGAGGDQVFQENSMVVTTSYTLTANKSASSVGPITINSGVTVTVPSGARWVVL